MREKIFKAIAEISENDIENIKEESDFVDDLEMDSLMFLDLIVKVEEITGKTIKPEVITKLKKVNDILKIGEVN